MTKLNSCHQPHGSHRCHQKLYLYLVILLLNDYHHVICLVKHGKKTQTTTFSKLSVTLPELQRKYGSRNPLIQKHLQVLVLPN